MDLTGKRSLAAIGECMVELSDWGDGRAALGFGGDTANTAVYLARLAGSRLAVSYVTALGDDPYSDAMVASWQAEGIATDLVARLPGRLPGLYAIRTDAAGERSFFYWRSAAAARDLLRPPALATTGRCTAADVLYLSGITLSILDEPQREALLALLDRARAGGTVVCFDSNYRPRGWPSAGEARRWIEATLRRVDVALPGFDDERSLAGDPDPAATIARHRALGVAEVVVKDAGRPVHLHADGAAATITVPPVATPVDTTAAGDSFNAGYLAARFRGAAPAEAVQAGARLATVVIAHRGAVIPRDAMPPGAS